MFLKNLILPAFLLLSICTSAQQPWREGEMQVRVYPVNAEDYAIIRQLGLNADECDGFLRCYLTPSELSAVNAFGIPAETEIPDLNQWSASFGPRGVPSGYYTVAELNEIADSLALNFPDICTLHELGMATGFNVLKALKISDNSATDENEAEVLFDGGIHGDEVGGPENMIRFARDLCLGYGTDEQITSLVNNREIWVYYCVNPYGRENMTRYNANGVDINRDGGYMWNAEGNSPSAFSQPETKVYRNLLCSNQFVIHCSYHSGTEFISYPWSYRASPTPDNEIHDFLASEYAAHSGYTNIPYEQGYTGMYAINGSTKDFGYGALGVISWSVEISVSKQPAASQIVPYYLKNRESMLTMTDYAGWGLEGVITDALTGEPLPATLYIEDYFPFASDPEVGDYHKFLLPGYYNLRVEANGYATRTFSQVMIPETGSAILNVSMTPSTAQFARRMITCQIPNNNFNDEGNTPAATGSPDNVRYSLGRMGYAVLDMGTPVVDGEGNDIIVYENDATPEGYFLYAGQTMDGPWELLGNATGNHEFDLLASGLPDARYIKIKDDGDGQSQVADAGFDLDAVEGIVRIVPADSTGFIEGYVMSVELGEAVAGATVSCGQRTTMSDEYGFFILEADTGRVEICASYPFAFMYGCDSVTVTPSDTLTNNIEVRIMEATLMEPAAQGQYFIYPVPAGDYFIIAATTAGSREILNYKLYSSTGIKVSSGRLINQETTVVTKNLPKGIYLLNISNGIKSWPAKVLLR